MFVCLLDTTRLSLLHLAALAGNVEAIKVLVERSADIMGRDSAKGIILHYAIRIGNAVKRKAVVSYLLELEVDFDAQNYGKALHMAAYEGYVDTIRLLLAKVNVNNTGGEGQTALVSAINGGWWEVVWLLLEAKADPNTPNQCGETPLYLAALKKKSKELVELLLKYDADPTVRVPEKVGDTILHKLRADVEIATLLLDAGADINALDDNGKTPLDRQDSQSTYNFLRAHGAKNSFELK